MAEANENEDVIEVAEIEEVFEGEGDKKVDKTDWKQIALDRHELAKKNYQIALRYKNKKPAVVDPKKPIESAKPDDKSGELDYGQKAYLVAKGIEAPDEVELVQKTIKETGKPLDQVIGSKFFQAELKELREARDAEAAIPKGDKGKGRSAQSSRDTVEYWIAKGELPPKDQVELRRKVVNARIKVEKDKTQFTDTPVVGR